MMNINFHIILAIYNLLRTIEVEKEIFKYAYEHVTSNFGIEIFYLTIYIQCLLHHFHNEPK